MAQEEFLDKWCAALPELSKGTDGIWRTSRQTEVSFPTEGHDELATLEERSFWFAHRNRVIASLVSSIPPSGPILDVGGGNGFVSLGLQQAGFTSVVVEPGPLGARVCQQRGVPVVQAAFQDLDIPSDSVPAIGMFDVLEHIEDDEGTLSRLHEVLEPGGLFYLAVPAYNWLWSREDVHAGHFRRYTLGDLHRKLERAGFAPEFSTYMFSPLVLPLLLLRAVPSRLGVRAESNPTQTRREHSHANGLAGRVLAGLLSAEEKRIAAGKRVLTGTSCLVAARAIKG